MTDVAIIGGGPAGLSGALFTAKNDLETIVFDTDDTSLHYAHLFNYLGIPSIDGDEFLEVARDQVADHGAERRAEEVTSIETAADGFVLTTAGGDYTATYIIFATGQSRELARELGCEMRENGTVAVDGDAATSLDGAYAAGWIARKDKVQAAISVGMGAAAALDILSEETGEPFHDFDTPDDAD